MSKTLRLLVLLALGSLVAAAVVSLRGSRSAVAELDGDRPLSGSFDTWPEVPRKQTD